MTDWQTYRNGTVELALWINMNSPALSRPFGAVTGTRDSPALRPGVGPAVPNSKSPAGSVYPAPCNTPSSRHQARSCLPFPINRRDLALEPPPHDHPTTLLGFSVPKTETPSRFTK